MGETLRINNCSNMPDEPTAGTMTMSMLPVSRVHVYHSKSVLRRVRNYCMLVLCLCFVIVASQHVVDTRQMLYKYMIL